MAALPRLSGEDGPSARLRQLAGAVPQIEMGPGIAARPHCAEYGFAGVRLADDPKAPRFSILTHQLRRRFRPGRIRGSSLQCSAPRPEGHLAFHRNFASDPKAFPHPELPRPFLGWPASRGLVSLGGKPPSQRRTDSSGASCRLVRILIFAASSPEGSSASILASIACRRRSDLPSLPLLPAVAGAPKWLGLPSRSPVEYAHDSESRKADSLGSSLWITGISSIEWTI